MCAEQQPSLLWFGCSAALGSFGEAIQYSRYMEEDVHLTKLPLFNRGILGTLPFCTAALSCFNFMCISASASWAGKQFVWLPQVPALPDCVCRHNNFWYCLL